MGAHATKDFFWSVLQRCGLDGIWTQVTLSSETGCLHILDEAEVREQFYWHAIELYKGPPYTGRVLY
jgi:hypothetical protein